MRNKTWLVVSLTFGIMVFSSMAARAQAVYINCSTGVAPFTPTTVGSNKSVEQQVLCNPGDLALGGGVETVSPPLPLPSQVTTSTPENSFLLSGETPIGWQVVYQNTNVNTQCFYSPNPPAKLCPSVQFRVCVSCLPATP
jgi:hypothetical protein